MSASASGPMRRRPSRLPWILVAILGGLVLVMGLGGLVAGLLYIRDAALREDYRSEVAHLREVAEKAFAQRDQWYENYQQARHEMRATPRVEIERMAKEYAAQLQAMREQLHLKEKQIARLKDELARVRSPARAEPEP